MLPRNRKRSYPGVDSQLYCPAVLPASLEATAAGTQGLRPYCHQLTPHSPSPSRAPIPLISEQMSVVAVGTADATSPVLPARGFRHSHRCERHRCACIKCRQASELLHCCDLQPRFCAICAAAMASTPAPSATPAPEHAAAQLPLFPSAAQPNVIRSYEKDEVYLHSLTDSCHDAVRRLLGPRQALLWARETKLLAELLYFGLTTGSGLQTLGEEYCDILQVTGRIGVPPGRLQRGLLVLLQALPPYLAEQVSTLQEEDEGFAAWQAARWQQQQQQQQQEGEGGGSAAQPLSTWRQAARRLGAWRQQARERLRQALAPGAEGWPAASVRLLREHGGVLLRLHLALFYIYGTCFQPAKRAAGVRYLFAGRTFEGRPSYHVLGVLLLAQLGVSGAMWAAKRAGHGGLLPGAGTEGGRQQEAQPRHARLLEADGSEASGAEEQELPLPPPTPEGVAAEAAGRKCPLCLSARDHPTATPCGHVFCWRCIAEWVSQKPECPLCRSEVATSGLVCVYHADF